MLSNLGENIRKIKYAADLLFASVYIYIYIYEKALKRARRFNKELKYFNQNKKFQQIEC